MARETETFRFYIVNYYGDTEKQHYVVPENWILEKKFLLPYKAWVYFNPLTIDIRTLPTSFLYQMKDENFNKKVKGNVYMARVLTGYGKYKKMKLWISFNFEFESLF